MRIIGLWNIAIHKPFYHYVIVRDDLPLGFLAAQVVHAAGESVTEPVKSGTHAIVLAVANEAELREVYQSLQASNVVCTLITEVDFPYEGQATAIGIRPVRDRDRLRRLVGKLRLLDKCIGSS